MTSSDRDSEDTTIYKVVVNHEEQYSIWPADRQNPAGWRDVEKSGPKAECLAHIKDVWTDMRPLSLRKQMEAANSAAPEPPPSSEPGEPEADDLVQRLCDGDHPIHASLRPESSARALKERIDRGYLHIKFVDTQGGTELGVRLDDHALDLSRADFERQIGSVHVEGGLTLNYVKVRCIADISLETLAGTGHLRRVEI